LQHPQQAQPGPHVHVPPSQHGQVAPQAQPEPQQESEAAGPPVVAANTTNDDRSVNMTGSFHGVI